ncbi:chemotaxis protein CheY [Campylobacter mucosalis]|uniref:response regulator n=1 Tax=Campylobacter mucosalis TaxID=202 RepID=UPI0004D4D2D2|nr:response regulator [Campylobacter mucosalis]KEA46295.1 chemotaxis protein CheY [Campylobacter mucosalis]QKF62768.1 response regulator receiver domain-containing protein [Campylobacter mucosalis]
MKVLIVDNEIYLAGSIATKLADKGHECEIAGSIKEALNAGDFDIVLLSTTFSGQNFYPVIEKFKGSIIILLVTYISNDTVSKPLEAGASDYIQKPFMIEELIRKINHFAQNAHKNEELNFYKNYISYSLREFKIDEYEYKKIKLPLLIKAPKIGYADKFVYEYSNKNNVAFTLIIANNIEQVLSELFNAKNEYIYILGIQNLSDDEKTRLFDTCRKRKIIISTNDFEQTCSFETISIAQGKKVFSIDEIATLDEYIRHVISTYQDKLPDTELSKRLGISRKSLWEKRKKYDIAKKK